DHYLRPIIRDMNQEAQVFSIPAAVAWQALTMDDAPDSQIMTRVQQIIVQLNSDNFPQRQKAEQDLRQMGPIAARALGKIDQSKLSIQQRSAIESITEEITPLPANQLRQMVGDKSALLDMLFNDD